MKNIFNGIWGTVAIIWLLVISYGLTVNVKDVQSAMQASQLYNEATTTILGLIATTLILILWEGSASKSAENSKRIADVLEQLEKRLDINTGLSTNNLQVTNEIRQDNSAVLSIAPSAAPSTGSSPTDKPLTSKLENHLCPKCHAQMVLRISTKGEHIGQQFYVCSNYPKCQEIIPIQ